MYASDLQRRIDEVYMRVGTRYTTHIYIAGF